MFVVDHSCSWLELLKNRAADHDEKLAYRFVSGKDFTEDLLTYGELYRRAISFSCHLNTFVKTNDRVLILLSSGTEYIEAFFGVMYASCIPVTGYQPRAIQQLERTYSIISDCSPSVIITDDATKKMIATPLMESGYQGAILTKEQLSRQSERVNIKNTDFIVPSVAITETAFLQYTSGSTSAPKGVKITHENLSHNCQLLVDGMGFNASSIVASWLPFHHDMGLIGKILCSLYAGVPCNFISPMDFVKKPLRWLELISRYRCTISGAPNFAYDLCVDRVSDDDVLRLDLSSWRVAWNGAEPIRRSTLQNFTEKFAPAGFRQESHHPCYGLAEGTLFVSAQDLDVSPVIVTLNQELLGKKIFSTTLMPGDQSVDYVSVGRPRGDTVVKIVDSNTHVECENGMVGELWVSSPSVGTGYWENTPATQDTFDVRLRHGDKPNSDKCSGNDIGFLRTGDLAVMKQGHIYIVGRIKDIFIINGVNIYPSDVEHTVDDSSEHILKSAVFSTKDNVNDLVDISVVCELDKKLEKSIPDLIDELGSEIAKNISLNHELTIKDIVFVRRGDIPKTTSGKVQRSQAKNKYKDQLFRVVHIWYRRELVSQEKEKELGNNKLNKTHIDDVTTSPAVLFDKFVAKIVSYISSAQFLDVKKIDTKKRIADFALSSLQILELVELLETSFHIDLPVEQFYQNEPTIEYIAQKISGFDDADIKGCHKDGTQTQGCVIVEEKYTQKACVDHDFTNYINPEFGRKLSQLKLDKEYVRAEGMYLTDSHGECYLDFLSQYGALPFGHNHPRIWEVIEAFHKAKLPSFVQPSFLHSASKLAKKLVSLAPSSIDYVTFVNSGAEAIEAAIKLAQSTTGRRNVLSTINSFHGKTLGALSATGREKYREHFGVFNNFHHVGFNDLEDLEKVLKSQSYAAFIVEPIQGEAGIICSDKEYLINAQRLCHKYGTLFVVDEVQTGMGRTGHVYYSNHLNLSPDIITLAKGLSGGVMPIGACLSSKRIYNEEFGNKHTSTYAGNGLACEVGICAVELITENECALLDHVKKIGHKLKRSLLLLQQKYPHLIVDVRGEGLMLGLHFQLDRYQFGSGILAGVSEEEFITSLLMSYLLNKEHVRVAFTLNQGNVLRVQPPLVVTWEECDVFITALERTLAVLDTGNMAKMAAHLVGINDIATINSEPYKENFFAPMRNSHTTEFAFLLHPLNEKTYVDFDKSLSALNQEQLIHLSGIFGDNFSPFLGGEIQLLSDENTTVTGSFWVVPRTAKDLTVMPAVQSLLEVQDGLNKAIDGGAKVIGLGAFTSTVSHGGLSLQYPQDVIVTTGNTYTTLVGFQSVVQAASLLNKRLRDLHVVIIGATGAIGKALTTLFAPFVSQLSLIGNPDNHESSIQRMSYNIRDLVRNAPEVKALFGLPEGSISQLLFGTEEDQCYRLLNSECVRLTTDLPSVISGADVIITATNSPDSFIEFDKIKDEAIFCDISRPKNMQMDLKKDHTNIFYFDGGVVELPFGNRLGLHTDLHNNQAYACMAETMLVALENDPSLASLGADITIERVGRYIEIAKRHGFNVHLPSHIRDHLPQSLEESLEENLGEDYGR